MKRLAVYLETGEKRTFAGAVEWPGWSRSGKTEADAIEALIAHGARYRAAMGAAAPDLEPPASGADIEVAERVPGGSGTDFGVPSGMPEVDERPVSATDLARLLELLQASWRAVETAARAAEGRVLRTGPRGGGRDLRKMLAHVLEAEEAYLREFGGRPDDPHSDDPLERWKAARRALLKALEARAGGEPPPPPGRRTRPFWTARYLVRRSAWHALDHAWEIEDRAVPAGDG